MKRYIVSGLLVAIAAVSAMADGISINSGRMMVGKVGVGSNIGGTCALMVNSSQEDLFSPKYNVTFSLLKVVDKKWVATRAEQFSMQSYSSGDLFGAKTYTDKKGTQKKVTASLFLDQQTQTYKVILHEAKLVSDGTTGKFIVCERMVMR
tara:strand:- start:37696 stop:38145 length:450 start_codon:yes stop_codon:yes gene_type:complete